MARFLCGLVAIATIGLILSAAARADEEKISLDKVPKPVLDAVKDYFKGAELKEASKENEDGKTVYEIVLKHKGHNIEAIVTPEGELTTYEREIASKDLPKAVVKTVEATHPKATYKLVEEVYKVKNKKEKMEYYEIALETSDKKQVEILVAPDGKIVKPEKKEKKD